MGRDNESAAEEAIKVILRLHHSKNPTRLDHGKVRRLLTKVIVFCIIFGACTTMAHAIAFYSLFLLLFV